MVPSQHHSLGTLALALILSGLLAGSLAGCKALRGQPVAETATALHPVVITTRTSSGQVSGSASTTPSNDSSDQLDTQVQTLETEMSNADTLNDLSTALPPDEATATPAAGEATVAPATDAPTSAPGPAATVDAQGTQVDQALSGLLDDLNNTDTVPEAANP